MKFVNARELRLNASRILRLVRHEDVVVTLRGKPAAAVIYVDDDNLEEFLLGRRRNGKKKH